MIVLSILIHMVRSALFDMTGPGDELYSAVALKELIVAIDSLDEASKMRDNQPDWLAIFWGNLCDA